MKNIFINTIVNNKKDSISQVDFLKKIDHKNIDIKGIEVRRELFSNQSVIRKKEFLAILEIGLQNEWDIFYSVPESLFTTYGVNENLTLWLDEADKMKAISIKCNIGDLSGIKKADKEELDSLLAEYRVQLTIENDQTEVNGKYITTKTAIDLIQKRELPIGYTFDLGNWVIMKEEASEVFASLREHITILHLKNVNSFMETTLLDEGIIDWQNYLLSEKPIVIEYPMEMEEIGEECKRVQEELTWVK